jgi:hypothetical protein
MADDADSKKRGQNSWPGVAAEAVRVSGKVATDGERGLLSNLEKFPAAHRITAYRLKLGSPKLRALRTHYAFGGLVTLCAASVMVVYIMHGHPLTFINNIITNITNNYNSQGTETQTPKPSASTPAPAPELQAAVQPASSSLPGTKQVDVPLPTGGSVKVPVPASAPELPHVEPPTLKPPPSPDPVVNKVRQVFGF